MGVTYIKLYFDALEMGEALTDGEFGRLIRGALMYARDGEAPDLSGNERILFPALKLQILRDKAAYDEKTELNRENGKKGGRPTKNRTVFEETEKNRTVFKETEKRQDKDKDKDKDKDYVSVTTSHTRTRATASPTVEEVAAYCQERQNCIDPQRFFDYYSAQGWKLSNGNPMKDWKAAVRNWESRDKQRQTVNNDGFIGTETDYSAIGAMMDEDW